MTTNRQRAAAKRASQILRELGPLLPPAAAAAGDRNSTLHADLLGARAAITEAIDYIDRWSEVRS